MGRSATIGRKQPTVTSYGDESRGVGVRVGVGEGGQAGLSSGLGLFLSQIGSVRGSPFARFVIGQFKSICCCEIGRTSHPKKTKTGPIEPPYLFKMYKIQLQYLYDF